MISLAIGWIVIGFLSWTLWYIHIFEADGKPNFNHEIRFYPFIACILLGPLPLIPLICRIICEHFE